MKTMIGILALLFFTLTAAPAWSQCSTPSQLDSDLTAASQADVISLSGVNPLNCPEIQMTQGWTGGKLIFSDSPEKPTGEGKLYEDTGLSATSGTTYNRVFAYHVNGLSGSGPKSRMKFTVLLKNTSGSSGTFQVQKAGTAGPTTSYLYAGKKAFERWLNSSAASSTSVPAGGYVRFDSTWDSTTAAPNYLMHGIWDYSFTQSHAIIVCALKHNGDPIPDCPGLSVLSRDSHQRGTFPYADKIYDTAATEQIDSAGGVEQFPIAGDTTNDSDAIGVDATDSSQQELNGNFGILYKIHLNTKSSDGSNLGLLFNPRGGTWGGAVWPLTGLLPGGRFLIPAGTGSTGDNSKGAVIGRWSPGSSLSVWMQFMPTGGSSFPLRVVSVGH